jgi:hypothetical protein
MIYLITQFTLIIYLHLFRCSFFLRERGIFATETIKENRLKNVGFASANGFKKHERGHYDYRFESQQEIMVNKVERQCC